MITAAHCLSGFTKNQLRGIRIMSNSKYSQFGKFQLEDYHSVEEILGGYRKFMNGFGNEQRVSENDNYFNRAKHWVSIWYQLHIKYI